MVAKTRITDESRAEGVEGGSLRWSIERRLAFIEERLFWLGEVNRTDLVRRFGVSMSQASADIARYLAHDPPGVIYDKSVKRYAAQADFRPVLAKPDAVRITTPVLSRETMERALEIIRKDIGGDKIKIDNPTQNLESYFLDVVQKARQAAAESKAVLDFFAEQVLAAARPKDQEGGLGIDATIRKAVDSADALWQGPGSRTPAEIHTAGEVEMELPGRSATIYTGCDSHAARQSG